MKSSIPLIALALTLGSTFLVACDGDDTSAVPKDAGKPDTSAPSDATVPSDTGTGTDAGSDTGTPSNPPAPTLGAQIDRMGRPAVNTATNHSFDANDTTKGAAKDAWNQNANPATWGTSYAGEIAKNLAILDAIDGECGNQLFADKAKTDATRYGTFAGVLADDRLWVNSAATACTTYLAVEANATKLLLNGDCGGRVPSYDVMKITYSAAAIGALSGVTDGTTTPAKSKVTAFPYLAP